MQYLNETGFKALIKLIKTKLITKSKLNNNSILKYVYGEVQEALPDEDYVKPVHYHTNAQLTNYNWFSYSSIAPSNTNLLWIDPKEGLKYHNGTAWVVVPIGFYESLDTTTTYTLTSGDNIGSVTIDGVAATLPVQIGAGAQIIIKSSSYNSNSYTMTPNFSISTAYQTSSTTGTAAVKTISFTMPAYNLTVGFIKNAVTVSTYTLTKGSNVSSIIINNITQSNSTTSFEVTVGSTVQINSNTFDSSSQTMAYSGTSITTTSNSIINNQRVITFKMPSKDITVAFTLASQAVSYILTYGSGVKTIKQDSTVLASGASVPAGTILYAYYGASSLIYTSDTTICTTIACAGNSCTTNSSMSLSVDPLASYTYTLYATNSAGTKKKLTTSSTTALSFAMPEYNCTISITRTTSSCSNFTDI